jgi:hypothetical protein
MIRQKSMKKDLKMKNSVYKDQKDNNQLFKSQGSQSKILKMISDYPLTQEKT